MPSETLKGSEAVDRGKAADRFHPGVKIGW
jgi:hypothetical protein